MFGFFKKSPPPPRESMLAAVPLRNPVVRQTTPSPGKTLLTAPIESTRMKRFFGTRATEKSFELDALGLEVWRACDGHSSVEQIITGFARQHRVNLREAEVAVSTFLRTLVGRNLLALAGSTPRRAERQAPVRPRKKKRRR